MAGMRGNYFYYRLGECIVRAREHRLMSQERVALSCDVDRTYIARIEKGKANPTMRIIYKIAKALRMNISTILKGL